MLTFLRATLLAVAAFFLPASLLAAQPIPVEPERLPRPETIASPAQAQALLRLAEQVVSGEASGADPLPELDRMLGEARMPTPLRGFIQFLRAIALDDRDRTREAVAAIEEGVRLLPGYSDPLLLAAHIETYNDRPGPAADYFLRAAQVNPAAARAVDDYDLSALAGRLRQYSDSRRLNLLAARLFEIGWTGDDIPLRSGLARDLIRARARAGDLAGARALLPNLIVPGDARALLLDSEFQALWPAIEAWAGPEQRRQWQLYMDEARGRWRASRDSRLAPPYVQALAAAGHDDTIIREMLPRFQARLDREVDSPLLFVANYVADALGRAGRWDEARAMFDRALQTWPLGSEANALNLAANRARSLLMRGDAAGALVDIDRAIADAAHWGGYVSAQPRGGMHYIRACALHRLGRDAEGLTSVAIAANNAIMSAVVDLNLCLGRPEAARRVLLDALGREMMRAEVLGFVQISGTAPLQSELGRSLEAGRQALRTDPAVLAAIARYGRVLPYALRAGAPAEEAPR